MRYEVHSCPLRLMVDRSPGRDGRPGVGLIKWSFCFALIFLFSEAFADWEHLANDDFSDIGRYGDSVIIVSSPEGRVLLSSDDGSTWKGTRLDSVVTSVHIGPSGTIFASGLSGRVFISHDLGRSWDTTYLPKRLTIYRVRSLSASTILAVGTNGAAAISSDQGATWESLQISSTPEHFYAMEICGDSIAVVGSAQGGLYRTSNAGATWHPLREGLAAVRSVYFDANGCGIIAGDFGLVLSSKDRGVTWRQLNIGDAKYGFQFGACLKGGRVFLSYVGGNLESSDSGETWQSTRFPQAGSNARCLRGIIDKGASLVGVGKPCMIVRSLDTARTWTYESLGIDDFRAFYNIQSIDSNTYIAVGEKNLVTYTVNGGLTWSNRIHPNFFYLLTDLHFWTLDSGIVVGPGGFCYSTGDRGKTWNRLLANFPPPDFYHLKAFGANEVVVTSDSTIWYSSDRMRTYSKRLFFPGNPGFNFTRIDLREENLWYATGYRSYWTSDSTGFDDALFLVSHDKGISWNIMRKGDKTRLDALAFVSDSIGVIGGQNAQIWKTFDGGNSWISVHESSDPSSITSIAFADSLVGYASLPQGRTLLTTDAGNTWTSDYITPKKDLRLGDRFYFMVNAVWPDTNTVLIAGSHGISRKKIDRQSFVKSRVDNLQGWENKLFVRTSPNPTSGDIQIGAYGLNQSMKESTRLGLYDVQGAIVRDLTVPLREHLQTGYSQFSVSLNGLPSGSYLLKLSDQSGSFVTRQILIH